jgi:alkylation response protein AidB-like acyl-CoA dehydrogenase
MDFAFTPEQEALRELARSICQDHATHERLKVVEREPDVVDRDLWAALARA